MLSHAPVAPEANQTPAVADALKKAARQLALFSALIGIATYASLSMIAPRYESEVRIAVVSKAAPATVDPAATAKDIGTLQSSNLLASVAADLGLAKEREFNSALGPVDALDAMLRLVGVGRHFHSGNETAHVITGLRNSLDVRAMDGGRAIAIGVTSLNPELSAKIANTLAASYGKILSAPADAGAAQTQPADVRILSKAEPARSPAFPKTVEMTTLATIAALLFGIAWIVMMTALRSLPSANAAESAALSNRRAEPLLTEEPDDPLVREMTETEASVSRETSEITIDHSAAEPATAPVGIVGIETIAECLKTHPQSAGGFRTLITCEADTSAPFQEAIELAKALAGSGAQAILIDWSPSGKGFARAVGLSASPGWNDLLNGSARFDGIIQRLPGTRVHAIASGRAMANGGAKLDPDLLNVTLDALDEVYEHIIVAAGHDEARELFEFIEGRFDAGITVVNDSDTPEHVGAKGLGNFLGFEVADIAVYHCRRPQPVLSPMAQRIAQATRPREAVALRS
ncbi:MAG: hypothetical protein QM780_07465 [Hyphomicrobium sp.]|uniref:hypothetical protein n=1 Tax=Hyphomicrobium sp. TaxID=82 RepID=UPI0039E2E785